MKERPTSLATVIPKRKRGGWDDNASKKKSKVDTVNAALDIVNTSDRLMEEMHQAYIQRGMRETQQMNGRMPLEEITNNMSGVKRKEKSHVQNRPLSL
jgi:hypothetical protein